TDVVVEAFGPAIVYRIAIAKLCRRRIGNLRQVPRKRRMKHECLAKRFACVRNIPSQMLLALDAHRNGFVVEVDRVHLLLDRIRIWCTVKIVVGNDIAVFGLADSLDIRDESDTSGSRWITGSHLVVHQERLALVLNTNCVRHYVSSYKHKTRTTVAHPLRTWRAQSRHLSGMPPHS